MALTVEFDPSTMYANAPTTRAEIVSLVRAHHQKALLGKDGKIYDEAVVLYATFPYYIVLHPHILIGTFSCNFHTSSHSGNPKEHCTVRFVADSYTKVQHVYRD